MSDSIEMTSCLRHRDNARYFIYYEDLQEISPEHPDKLAAFIRVLEVKTNKRIVAYAALLEDAIKNGTPIPSLNLWLEVSYTDFVYWSLGTLGRSSFQTADKVAQKKLLVKSRVLTRPIRPDDPDSPKVPYKEYILVRENAQAAIDKQEAPIQGEDYEKYGETPPVIENIPLLKKTGDMLRETRGGMLEKTRPPVEKNSNLNKVISNGSKESKKSNMSSSDDAPSSQSEKDEYEKRITELEERIAYLLQVSKDGSYPPEPPKGSTRPTITGQNDTPLTPTGSITSAQETQFPQSSTSPENQEAQFLDNAGAESPNRPKIGLAESQGVSTPHIQDTGILGPLQTQEMPSSTQADVDTSNQATEQQQASGDDPIATQTTNNQPTENPPATKKPRGGKSSSKKATEINEVMQKRVEKVYEYFDKLKQEVMQKPDAHYRRTGTDTEAIIAWLDSHPTEEILREVYLRLWNTPVDKRTNFSWKKNMWIHSVLKQYEVLEMEIADERNKQAKRNVVTPGTKSTFVPPVEEEDEMAFVLPSQLRKRG